MTSRYADQVAIAVPTRDRPKLVARCILPALAEAVAAGFEAVVVDQSEGTETAELARSVAGLHYVRALPGVAHARNAAAHETTAPVIVYVDDDVIVSDPVAWLERYAQAFARAPDAGAVCGRGVTAKGAVMPGRVGTFRWPTNPFGLGSGFNLGVRRTALEQVAGFDEDFGPGGRYPAAEDTDLLYRLLRSGWAIVCSDEVTVVHDTWRSLWSEVVVNYLYGVGAGAQTAKHLRRGDRVAGRIALGEAGLHLVTLARALVLLRPTVALVQLPFVAGLAAGLLRASAPRPPRAGT